VKPKCFNNTPPGADSPNVGIAALLKACFLFSATYILFQTIHIPEIFLTTMGLIQLYTALIGGTLATIFLNSKKS
jgi:hypothetical protein